MMSCHASVVNLIAVDEHTLRVSGVIDAAGPQCASLVVNVSLPSGDANGSVTVSGSTWTGDLPVAAGGLLGLCGRECAVEVKCLDGSGTTQCKDTKKSTISCCDPVPSTYALAARDQSGQWLAAGDCVKGGSAVVVAPPHEGPVVWTVDGSVVFADPLT